MGITKYVDFDFYLNRVKAKSTERILQIVSRELAPNSSISAELMEEICVARVSNGGICVENGIAIFDLTSRFIKQPVTVLATLECKMNLQAPDGKPVNLFVGVISPVSNVSAHLQHLSAVVRLFRSEGLCKALRVSRSADEMKALFMPTQDWMVAA